MTTVVENIVTTLENLGDIELSGIKLEDANPELLNVAEHDFDKHVAGQPAAIAYYGALKKESARRLGSLKRVHERWEKKKYAEAKVAAMSGTSAKVTIADIEARFIVDNEKEIEKYEKQLEKAQCEYDTLDAWYEAWRQKSFSIREFASVAEDEKYNSSNSISFDDEKSEKKGDRSVKMDRVRDIMRKRKERSDST